MHRRLVIGFPRRDSSKAVIASSLVRDVGDHSADCEYTAFLERKTGAQVPMKKAPVLVTPPQHPHHVFLMLSVCSLDISWYYKDLEISLY